MLYLGFDCMHHFFGLNNDIYVANIYIVPEGPSYHDKETFCLLYDQLSKIPANADIALCGDYNARTGVMSEINADFWNGGNGELDRLIPENADENSNLIEKMYADNMLVRKSKDASTINKHGRELLGLCKSTGLLIFNGRLGQDRGIGEYTRDDTTGRSVVDYVIRTPLLFLMVNDFRVLPKFPESDHKAIAF